MSEGDLCRPLMRSGFSEGLVDLQDIGRCPYVGMSLAFLIKGRNIPETVFKELVFVDLFVGGGEFGFEFYGEV